MEQKPIKSKKEEAKELELIEALHDIRDKELVEKRLKDMREGKTVKVKIDEL